jgi:hypothetical protein
MSTFGLYLSLGIDHISDLTGYDHILFLTALCAVYSVRVWTRILILVTAFTIGHTLTLALATLDILQISTGLIEFLIPVTIFVTGLSNTFQKSSQVGMSFHRFKYGVALFFGLIHGLGFSNYLRSLLGGEQDLVLPLFAFNLGLEIGQILIVAGVLFISFLLVDLGSVRRRDWNLLLSGAAMGVSLILAIERWPL